MIGMRRRHGVTSAISDLRPGSGFVVRDENYETLEWFDESTAPPTEEEVQARIVELEAAEPMRCVRDVRNWYLAESDWTQGYDIRALRGSEWCAAWDSYRQELRDLPDSGIEPYFDEMDFLRGVDWPQQPQ